jgi:uncharacterized protein (DUF2147 family)
MPNTLRTLSQRPVKLALLSAVAAATLATTALAGGRTSPHGYWKTIDDETGETKSIVKLYEVEGKLYGRVDKLLLRPGALCEKCDGDDHNKPIEGMVVVWGLSDPDGDGTWSGGQVFDPEKNKTYRCKLWLEDGNIRIRGYLGPFFRTQNWLPYNP